MEEQLTKSPSLTERRAYWRDELLQWAQSGLTQKQFCQQRGLSGHAFVWWKARYRDELNLPYRAVKTASTKKHNHRFVEVKVSSGIPTPPYEVVLANSRCIRVDERFDPEVLMKLITAVEAIC
jgi:hypothetical protein